MGVGDDPTVAKEDVKVRLIRAPSASMGGWTCFGTWPAGLPHGVELLLLEMPAVRPRSAVGHGLIGSSPHFPDRSRSTAGGTPTDARTRTALRYQTSSDPSSETTRRSS